MDLRDYILIASPELQHTILMPSGKVPKGKPVASATQRNTIQSFTIKRAGPRNAIATVPGAGIPHEQVSQDGGITLRPPDMDAIQAAPTFEDSTSLLTQPPPNPPILPDIEVDEIFAEIDEVFFEAPRRGKVCWNCDYTYICSSPMFEGPKSNAW